MNSTDFRLYRLNFVDRISLFANRLSSNQDIFQVMSSAGTERFDIAREGTRSGSRWSLRNVVMLKSDEELRPYISALFSHETTWRFGTTVTPESVVVGRATITPAPAVTAQVFLDLGRHIVAIEDVPALMQKRKGWKGSLQLILNTAAHDERYTSRFSFEEIPPKQVLEQGLSTFEKVTRIRATLRIPNPDLSPVFQPLFDEMQSGKVRQLSQDIRNEDGLDLTPEKLPKMTLDMAVSGYRDGTIRVSGYKDGKKDKLIVGQDAARISLRDFVHGYEAGASNQEASRMAKAIQGKIDELLG